MQVPTEVEAMWEKTWTCVNKETGLSGTQSDRVSELIYVSRILEHISEFVKEFGPLESDRQVVISKTVVGPWSGYENLMHGKPSAEVVFHLSGTIEFSYGS